MEKKEIKSWLKAIGKNREWLAEKTGAARLTINTWLSTSRPIPKRATVLISELMVQHPTNNSSPSEENSLTLTVDSSTFDHWNTAAAQENKLLRQWAIDTLNESTNQQ